MSQAVITPQMAAEFSEPGFWRKLTGFALVAGRQVVEKALWLYYAAERPETPKWARATVYGALGYFILPADAVPDVLPIAGYGDDLAVLIVAVTTIGMYINDEVRGMADATLTSWFGP